MIKFISFVVCLLIAHMNFSMADETSDSQFQEAEITSGERLFLETRFAYTFYKHVADGGDINAQEYPSDPKLDKTVRFFGLPPYQIPFAESPFKGTAYSCRTCHMVDEHVEQKELGMRAYNDFASKSPVSERSDQQTVTVRNSPILVDSALHRENFLLHYDGEFASLSDLIVGTLTGRNMGWLPNENEIAANHACDVIKNDNGDNELAKEFGSLSYRELFSGTLKSGETVAEENLISPEHRFNVNESSCDKIIQGIVHLISEYIIDLKFQKEEHGPSPYDYFLTINKLPTKPAKGESDQLYTNRLLSQIVTLQRLNKLKLVDRNPNTEDGRFKFHDQPYRFGKTELQGLYIFFNKIPQPKLNAGNCGSCHPAPHFTDFSLHNVGVTQVEYESIHGQNSFNKLRIPTLEERNKNADTYLPANSNHPNRKGIFRQASSETTAHAVDLGAWNILFNDDYPNPQDGLYNLICTSGSKCKTKDQALQNAIATFKTPSLRDLGHSAPYMHNGQINDLHAILGFYIAASINSRRGVIRNADEELKNMNISPKDIKPLVSFLFSLYEDYN